MAAPLRRFQPRASEPSGKAVFPWSFVATLVFIACMAMYAWLWIGRNKAVGAALLIVPVLVMLTMPFFIRRARKERHFDLAGLLATGMLLRFAASYFRFDDAADAHVYHKVGTHVAQSLRNLNFSFDVGRPIPGTGTIRYATGIVHVFTNSSKFGTFLVFAWIGFWGCYLLYKAFVTALPDADRYRYARLLLLWPSLVFWPSSIGKEALMLLAIGLAALGAARIFTRRAGGYSLLLLGEILAYLIRPHVAMILLIALVLALVLGRTHGTYSRALTPASVAKVAALVVLLVGASVLAARTADFLGVKNLQLSSAQQAFETTRGHTAAGGSHFSPAHATSPLGYPQAAMTILFRPFPFEADRTEQFLAAAEALGLALLTLASWRRLASVPGRIRHQPYVGFALVYALVFIFVFAAISNFGILVRERIQLVPLVFVLLSVGAAAAARRERSPTPANARTR